MIYSPVIIIGGGPAGATCGWKLKEYGIDALILDKQPFPRTKLCAGWITPGVFKDLRIHEEDYPNSLTEFSHFKIHLHKKVISLPVQQYAIRRYEFDDWLLKRSGVALHRHEVMHIEKDGDYYCIDNKYSCRYLVGAGGTHCPVYRTFFKRYYPRDRDLLIVTLEEEFPYTFQDPNCHLWFLQNRLPGYSWYVPKEDGYVNIGIGGFFEKLKANSDSIHNQWQYFIRELERLSLVKAHQFRARGYVYYLRSNLDAVQKDNIFVIGDAAGLATKDMGEGIGPAVSSGILAAEAICSGNTFSLHSVKRRSFAKYPALVKLVFAYLLNPEAKV